MIPHNDWNNSISRAVLILKKYIISLIYKKATGIMYEAHSRGTAIVKS